MRTHISAIALLAGIGISLTAAAQHAPVQYLHEHAINAVYSEWTVPYRQNGALLSLQALGITNDATVAVGHISSYGAGLAVTNAVETAAAADTLHVYPSAYLPPFTYAYATSDVPVTVTVTPAKPVWLAAGDKLSFTLSATNSAASIIIKTALRD